MSSMRSVEYLELKTLRCWAVFVFSVVTLAGCASDDFMVRGHHRQQLPLEGVEEVVVRCYCPDREIAPPARRHDLAIESSGNYGSSGYHGPQEKPKSLPKEFWDFVSRREGKRLILESREFTYMHHSQLLKKVKISVPANVAVQFDVLSYGDLFDRQVH